MDRPIRPKNNIYISLLFGLILQIAKSYLFVSIEVTFVSEAHLTFGALSILPHRDQQKTDMTWCIMHTYKAKGFHLGGVEAGFECWCGYVSPPKNKIASGSECNKPCRGNSDIKCGGD